MDIWIDWLKGSGKEKLLPFKKEDESPKASRPRGITFISILSVLTGLSSFYGVFATEIAGHLVEERYPEFRILWIFDYSKELAIAEGSAFGAFFLVMGIWLFQGHSIARKMLIGSSIYSIGSGVYEMFFPSFFPEEHYFYPIVSSPIVSVILLAFDGIIIYYLFRSNVKEFFQSPNNKQTKKTIPRGN